MNIVESGAWEITAKEFPKHAEPEQKLRFLLRYAMLAPSRYNTQPWSYRITDVAVELHADKRRALVTVDPFDRELIIACGGSLYHLRLALRYFGFKADVEEFPDDTNEDFLARIPIIAGDPPNADEATLFDAMPRRRTVRNKMFAERELSPKLIDDLERSARAEGVWLELVQAKSQRDAIAKLIEEAHRIQQGDRHIRDEFAKWLRAERSDSGDGIPGSAFDEYEASSPFTTPQFVSIFDPSIVERAPVFSIIGSHGNAPPDWLRAGQALAHVLIRAAASGVSASYFNEPIEQDEVLPKLQNNLAREGHPQILMRMGYCDAQPEGTPRRLVDDALL